MHKDNLRLALELVNAAQANAVAQRLLLQAGASTIRRALKDPEGGMTEEEIAAFAESLHDAAGRLRSGNVPIPTP